MKKPLLFIGLALLPGVLFLAWMLYEMDLHPTWQPELDKYIAYKEQALSSKITVETVEKAAKPWEFTKNPNFIVYSDSYFFQSASDYQPTPEKSTSPDLFHKYNSINDGVNLSYPPDEVWCALLKIKPAEAGSSTGYQVIFIARFEGDMYVTSWIIQEPTASFISPETLQTVSTVGCNSQRLLVPTP